MLETEADIAEMELTRQEGDTDTSNIKYKIGVALHLLQNFLLRLASKRDDQPLIRDVHF